MLLASLWSLHTSVEGPFELEQLLWPSQREGFATYRHEFPRSDDQLVVVGGGDAAQREGVVDQIVARFPPGLAYGAIDISAVRPTMLYFLTPEQLAALPGQLVPLAKRLAQKSKLEDWLTGATPSNAVADLYLKELEASLATRGRHVYESPLLKAFALPDAFWQLLEGRTRTYVTLPPDYHVVMVGRPLPEVRQVVKEVLQRNPLMTARISGTAAIVDDQRRSLEVDLIRVVGLCLAAMLLLRRPGYPVLPLVHALLCVVPSLALTLAVALKTLGVAALIAFPMAVVVSACLACLAAFEPSRRRTVRAGLLLAGAFIALPLLTFPGAALLSLVLVGAVLSATLALTTLLRAPAPGPDTSWEVGRPTSLRQAALLLVVAVGITGLAGGRPLRFEADFVGLLDQNTESLIPERLLEARGQTGLTAFLTAQNVDQAHRLTQKLRQLPSVASVSSVAEYIPPDVEQKRPLVAKITPILAKIRTPRPIPLGSAADLLALAARLQGMPQIASLQKLLDSMGPGTIQDGLNAFQTGFLGELEKMVRLLRAQRADPPSLTKIPRALRERMVSPEGHPSIVVSPASPLRTRESLARFVSNLRRVTPNPSGPAVLLAGLAQGYAAAAERAPLLAWGALGILTLATLVSISRTALVMLVSTLALAWTRGLLSWWEVPLNPWNWPAQGLLLALGVILCIGATDRPLTRPVVWPHVLILGGFLTLLLSHHPALNSLGALGAAGMACNLLAAALVIPVFSKDSA